MGTKSESESHSSPSPLLELRDVEFRYQSQDPLFSEVNLVVGESERIGLVGANGCGKTTLLKIMVGLMKPTQGEVIAFGSIRRHERDFIDVRARVGFVFQESEDQLFCPTVLDDVVFGPLNLGRSSQEAHEIGVRILDQVGLSGLENRVTYRLSVGQKRLVSLACVLSMEPVVLLLDEPTSGLDESAFERILNILMDLPQAMIVVSHEKRFVKSLAHKVVVMKQGKLVAETCGAVPRA